MKRLLNLIVVALIFAAVVGALSQYALGTRVATISAQDDHGDDGDDGDSSDHDDGDASDHDGDGGDHDGASDTGEGHTDDPNDSPTFEYLEGDSGLAMFEGIVFDPATEMDAMREAGLFGEGPDPVKTGVGAPSDPVAGFFDHATGAVFDPLWVQYYDPTTGQFDPEHHYDPYPNRVGGYVDLPEEFPTFAYLEGDSGLAMFQGIVFDPRSAMEVSPEERLEQYERLWAEPGFKKWLSNFHDVMLPGEANEDYAGFVRQKIRERVNDPVVAEMLVPKDHMFGSKRLPCESGYYKVFNQDNVLLVDVRQDPIQCITPKGVKTSGAEYELDVIIFATGYDAVTGALNRMDIRGEGGKTLKDKFADGPRTYMGISSAGFPNLFTINAASVGNFVRAAEPLVEWVSECINYVRENEFTRISATPEAEEAWVNHVNEQGAKILRTQADSWFVGANIPGRTRVLLTSPDIAPVMRAKVAANGYEGFLLQ